MPLRFAFQRDHRSTALFVVATRVALVAGLLALVAVPAPSSASTANEQMIRHIAEGVDIGSRLESGQSLRAGEYLRSPNGRYVALNRATDSLLVVFDTEAKIGIWSTGVFGEPGGRVLMRADGNLVEYRAGEEIWQSNTVSPEAVAVLQNNGKLVLYGKQEGRSGALWANGELLLPAAQAPVVSSAPIPEPVRFGPGDLPDGPVGRDATVVVEGIRVHAKVAGNVAALLAHARADGIELSGWGWRDNATQIRLRREHCGTSHYAIYEMSSSRCSPPTARPGRSLHERGLAIDFTYNGRIISSRNSPAFHWLAANAPSYGFHNLPSEQWHWSTNGR